MGLLEEIESKLEKLVEGIFSSKFPSKLEPIEIVRQLKKKMEKEKMVSVDTVYVPHIYEIKVSEEDYQHLSLIGKSLTDELSKWLEKEAVEENWSFTGKPQITISPSPDIKLGNFKVLSKGEPAMKSPAEIAGVQNRINIILKTNSGETVEHSIDNNGVILGRAASADINIPGSKISRYQAKIFLSDGKLVIEDLNSTNGTFVNEKRVDRTVLNDNDKIRLANIGLTLNIKL